MHHRKCFPRSLCVIARCLTITKGPPIDATCHNRLTGMLWSLRSAFGVSYVRWDNLTQFSGTDKGCVTSLKLGTGSHTSMAGVLLTSIVVCMLIQPCHPVKHWRSNASQALWCQVLNQPYHPMKHKHCGCASIAVSPKLRASDA